jgi:hypothetical protein
MERSCADCRIQANAPAGSSEYNRYFTCHTSQGGIEGRVLTLRTEMIPKLERAVVVSSPRAAKWSRVSSFDCSLHEAGRNEQFGNTDDIL